MSYKLIDAILDGNAATGMTKFVLVALAKYANDDGTSIHPSITTVAKRCGIRRQTVYNHIDRLIAACILREVDKRHYTGHGHYTVEYAIDPAQCASAVQCPQNEQCPNDEKAVSTTETSSVQSVDATLSILPHKTPSSGVSKQASKGSLATLAPAVCSASPKSNGTNGSVPYDLDELRNEGWVDLILSLLPLYAIPVTPTHDPEIEACLWFKAHGWSLLDVTNLWNWNLAHKRGTKLEFYTLAQAAKAADSDNPKSILAQWHKCQTNPCKKCPPVPPAPQDEDVEVPRQAFEVEKDCKTCGCNLACLSGYCSACEAMYGIAHEEEE